MNKYIKEIKQRTAPLLRQKTPVIIGIDGQCAAGKTTFAAALGEELGANVFHMDDFFLRPEQRTPVRYAEAGGNVDYERFQAEVLLPLAEGEAFSYRPFDCRRMELGEAVAVSPKPIAVVEGTYALHPYNARFFDFSILMRVGEELQRERILRRSEQLREKFFKLWIPLEREYFAALGTDFDMILG